jgi:hypothetical protein
VPSPLPWQERLWAGINKSGGPAGCWPWVRSTCRGYGQLSVGGRMRFTHRLVHELCHGPIPEGYDVLHSCDNPSCCNPAHLWAGTVRENMKDRDRKGRGRVPDNRGSRHGMSKLTEKIVVEIRAAYAAGEGSHRTLATRFGISHQAVAGIVTRETWRHV